MKRAGIPTEGMYFVDAVSSKVGSMEPDKRAVFVSSPQALTELSIAIKKCVDTRKLDFVLFDSLSTLLVYEELSSMVKFVHSVISALRVKGKSCVFTLLKEDIKEELVKDLGMFADKVEEID
jgi:archaellum biogenesis ATPase FlaH